MRHTSRAHAARAAAPLFAVALLASCRGESPRGAVWLHDALAPHLEIDPDSSFGASSSPIPLWRRGDLLLTAKTLDSLSSVQSWAANKTLVMVTFEQGSPLATSLHGDPLTVAYVAPTADRRGLAMVHAADELVLHGLAAAAHAESGHACGAVELMTLLPLVATQTLTPPVYDTQVALAAVPAVLATTDKGRIQSAIGTLEALGSRYHATESGLQTTDTVQQLFTAAIAGKVPADIKQMPHEGFSGNVATQQKSLIVTFPGASDDAVTVVIGAHLDSINRNGADQPAPGADDDASGVATMVEVARVIADSGLRFERRVELQAYAAEEVGLIGSAHIAKEYAASGRTVAAMLQMDMNAYTPNPQSQTIHFVINDTSPALRRSAKDVLSSYLGGDYGEKSLSAGTSDHRSWTRNGYAAVFPFEDPHSYNTRIHSPDDTAANAPNVALSERFAKLVVAFLAHHAGLVGAGADYEAARAALKEQTPRDLKLAINVTDAEGLYAVGISGPAGLSRAEICPIGAAGAMGCTGERYETTRGTDSGGRSFFAVPDGVPLTAGARLAVFGYNAEDKMVLQRSVRVEPR